MKKLKNTGSAQLCKLQSSKLTISDKAWTMSTPWHLGLNTDNDTHTHKHIIICVKTRVIYMCVYTHTNKDTVSKIKINFYIYNLHPPPGPPPRAPIPHQGDLTFINCLCFFSPRVSIILFCI